jgi:Raf kinase inhibitor-like YbhB/YbcL family protein
VSRLRHAFPSTVVLLVTTAACAAPGAGGTPPATETPMDSTRFELHSTSFAAGGSIPVRFTCDGEDVSPDIAWSGAPDGTTALVLVVDDPDANGFTHWIVYDMTGSDTGALPLGVSASPDAPPQGTNDFGRIGWNGPCPPSGEHRYRFTLSALAAPLEMAGSPRAADVGAALGAATVLGTAVLEARYRRSG